MPRMASKTVAELIERHALAPARVHATRPAKRATPPERPDDDDTTDPPESVMALADLIGVRVGILYADANGDETDREVTVNAVERRSAGLVLSCYCHARTAPRAFRLDRVRSVYDIDTGEILGDGDSFANTHARAPAALAISADLPAPARVAAAIAAVRAELHVLVFLARCDGWHASELSVACNLVLDRALPDIDVAELERQVRRLDPDIRTFRKALARFEWADTAALDRLVRAVRRLVAADGALSDDEWKFVDEMSALIEPKLDD